MKHESSNLLDVMGGGDAMLPRLIGLCGAIGAGKSTAAKVLRMHGYTILPLAGPLKDMLKSIGLTEDDVNGHLKHTPNQILCGKTPRDAMQTLGTEWGRTHIGDDFWLSLWRDRFSKAGPSAVDDARFPNEFEMIKAMGGKLITITRPAFYSSVVGMHESEQHWMDVVPDYEISNHGTIDDLRRQISGLIAQEFMATA